VGTFFSDTFDVGPSTLDEYGAFDISIVNDLPLFIDPFLLFHSEKDEYRVLHEQIIEYLIFLRDRSAAGPVSDGQLHNWYCFPEVKQNWFGFSLVGNGGSGLGMDFARELHANLNVIFTNFGDEKITESSHLEKVCLVSDGVGRDNISDFVTNLIQDYLCRYTEKFADAHLDRRYIRKVWVNRASFNYTTESWERRQYQLPFVNGDHVLLTPKDMLTRDETWINRTDLLSRFEDIPTAIPDGSLRAAVTNYFELELSRRPRKHLHATQKDRYAAAAATIRKYPDLIDYYIKLKEIHGEDAVDLSSEKVLATELFFSKRLREILKPVLETTDFYKTGFGTYGEAHVRLAYLKHVIEDMDGWRIFYLDGQPIGKERDVQILYRLVWFGTSSTLTPEANSGRGPVDFNVGRSREKNLVELKLASNTKLEQNLKKQAAIYEVAADAQTSIKAIVYFSASELAKVNRILKSLGLLGHRDIVLIDARADNKPSGSKAK
jgi:hypothetical protein